MVTYNFWDLDFNQKDVFNEVTRIVSFLNEHWRNVSNIDEIWSNLQFLCDWWDDFDWLDFYEFKTKNLAEQIISIHKKYWYRWLDDTLSIIVHYFINQWWLFDRKWLEELNNEIVTTWLYNSLMNEDELNWDYKTYLTSMIENYSTIDNIKDLTNSSFQENDWDVVSNQDFVDVILKNFYVEKRDSVSWQVKLDYRLALTYFDWIRNWTEDISRIYNQLTYIVKEVETSYNELKTIEWLSKNFVKSIIIECLDKTWLLDIAFNNNKNWEYFKFNEQDYSNVFRFLTSAEWVNKSSREVINIKQTKLKDLDLSEVKLINIFEDSLDKDLIDSSFENFVEQIKNRNWNKEHIFKLFKNKVENFDEYLNEIFYEFEELKSLVVKYWTEDLTINLYKNNWETEKFAKFIFNVLWEWFFNNMNEVKMKILNQIDYQTWMISRIWTQHYNFKADYDVIEKAFKTSEPERYLSYFWQFDKYKEELLDKNWNRAYKDTLIKVLKSHWKISLYDLLKVYIDRSSYENELLQIEYIKKDEFFNELSLIIQHTGEKLNWLSIVNVFHKVFEKNWIEIKAKDYLDLLRILWYNQKMIDHYFTVISEIYSKMFSNTSIYEKKLLQIENEKDNFANQLENNIKWISKSISTYKWNQGLLWKISKFFWNVEDEKEIYKQIVQNLEYISHVNSWKLDTLELSLKEIEEMLRSSNEFKRHVNSENEENKELWDRFIEQIERNKWILEVSRNKMNLYIESYKNIWKSINDIKDKLKTLDVLVWMNLIEQVDQDLHNKIKELKKN